MTTTVKTSFGEVRGEVIESGCLGPVTIISSCGQVYRRSELSGTFFTAD